MLPLVDHKIAPLETIVLWPRTLNSGDDHLHKGRPYTTGNSLSIYLVGPFPGLLKQNQIEQEQCRELHGMPDSSSLLWYAQRHLIPPDPSHSCALGLSPEVL